MSQCLLIPWFMNGVAWSWSLLLVGSMCICILLLLFWINVPGRVWCIKFGTAFAVNGPCAQSIRPVILMDWWIIKLWLRRVKPWIGRIKHCPWYLIKYTTKYIVLLPTTWDTLRQKGKHWEKKEKNVGVSGEESRGEVERRGEEKKVEESSWGEERNALEGRGGGSSGH